MASKVASPVFLAIRRGDVEGEQVFGYVQWKDPIRQKPGEGLVSSTPRANLM